MQVGNQADHFHQQVEIGFLLGGNIHKNCFAAPLFRDQAAIGELLLHALGQRARFVNFVDCNNDRHFGGVGVVNGFDGLRHHAVVGGDDQHDNVRGFGAARTHAGEGFVAGRIEEHDLTPVGGRVFIENRNFVGTDVLGDSAGFATGNVGGADGIEQRGFAVIDVAHDGDHGRTRQAFGGGAFFAGVAGGDVFRVLLFEGDDVGFSAEEARHLRCQVGFKGLVDGREHAFREQTRDQILSADFKLLGEIFYADAFGNGDGASDRQRLVRKRKPRRRSEALHRAFFHSTRNVALSGTARWAAGAGAGASGAGRRKSGADTHGTRAGRACASRMHGTAFAGTQGRTRAGGSGRCRTRALENWLAGNGAAGYGAACNRLPGSD